MGDETKIIRIIVDSSKAVDGSAAATRALQALEQQSATMDSTLSRIEKSLESVGTTVRANLYLAIVQLVDKLKDMATESLRAVAGLDEMAQQAGVTTKFFQSMQYAATQNGVAIDEVQQGITKFSQKMGEAANGSKPVIDALTNLGVKNLDLQGKLRPTEALMQDVAVAILAIDDPAKRVSESVALFGRAGAKMIPLLHDIAGGADAMAMAAAKAGTMVDGTVIESLHRMESQSEATGLKMRALFATLGAPIITSALEAVNKILSDILANLNALKQMERAKVATANTNDANDLDSQIAAQQGLLAINPNNTMAQSSIKALQARKDAATQRAQIASQVLMSQDEAAARVGGLPMVDAPGAGTTVSKEDQKTAESLAERIKKETDALTAARAAQDAMTAAARQGDTAFQDQQAHAEALTKAIDIYGGKLDATDPRVQKLTASLEDQIKKTKEGASAQNFIVATTELQKQNVLLEAQNELYNAAPEIQAREIALIKSKQDAEKAGNVLTADDVENRRAAIEANERLKAQAGELKAAQELWTAPLKTALSSIQTAGTDAFEALLDTGNFSFQSLADTFTKVLKRMAAEFLSLALLRPVMGVVVQGLAGAGIVSQSTVSQLGFGGGIAPGILNAGTSNAGAASGGSIGGFGLPTGGLSGLLSSSPFANTGGGAGSIGSIDELISGGGAGIQAGAGGSIFGAGGSGLSGLSAGQALGGIGSLAGIGFGAYNLINSKSTGGAIGGAAGILGGGLGLAALAFPALASTLGPIGLGVGLLGMLAPSLFGGGDSAPAIPPQPALVYNYGGFSPNAAGGYTADRTTGASDIATSVLGLIHAAGASTVPGKLWGGDFAEGVNHVWNGSQWQAQPYTNAGLSGPNGQYQALQYDHNESPQAAAELLAVAAFAQNVRSGGVSGATPSLIKGLDAYGPTTIAQAQNIISLATAYDKLGKAANPVKDSIDKVTASFDQLTQFAGDAGLSLDPINAEMAKQTKRAAQDFIDGMLDPLAVQMRALQDQEDAAMASAQYINDNVAGVYADTNKIAAYYLDQRAALDNQYYSGAVDNLKALIANLTYGSLADASPDTSLSGTKAAYNAALAQARGGDQTAIANLSTYAQSYATSAQSYFASGPEYQALIAQIRQDLSGELATIDGSSAAGAGADLTTASATASAQQYQQMVAMFQQSQNDNADLRDKLTQLIAQMQRAN